jgi:hypothetical protein
VKHYCLRSINSLIVWNKKEFPEQWKESIIAPVYRKGDKTDRGISLLSTAYTVLSKILILSPYTDEIIWDHYCGF